MSYQTRFNFVIKENNVLFLFVLFLGITFSFLCQETKKWRFLYHTTKTLFFTKNTLSCCCCFFCYVQWCFLIKISLRYIELFIFPLNFISPIRCIQKVSNEKDKHKWNWNCSRLHGGIKNCVDKFSVNRKKKFFSDFCLTSGTQLEQYSIVYDPWCQTKI